MAGPARGQAGPAARWYELPGVRLVHSAGGLWALQGATDWFEQSGTAAGDVLHLAVYPGPCFSLNLQAGGQQAYQGAPALTTSKAKSRGWAMHGAAAMLGGGVDRAGTGTAPARPAPIAVPPSVAVSSIAAAGPPLSSPHGSVPAGAAGLAGSPHSKQGEVRPHATAAGSPAGAARLPPVALHGGHQGVEGLEQGSEVGRPGEGGTQPRGSHDRDRSSADGRSAGEGGERRSSRSGSRRRHRSRSKDRSKDHKRQRSKDGNHRCGDQSRDRSRSSSRGRHGKRSRRSSHSMDGWRDGSRSPDV
jgi:hypothetical protein